MPRRIPRAIVHVGALLNRKELAPRWALLVACLIMFLLVLGTGYGNDIASCQRTQTTRAYASQRNDIAVAFQRSLAAKVRARADEEAELGRLLDTTRMSRADRMIVAWIEVRADADRADARDYRRYADRLARKVAPPVDCSRVPPST